MTVVMSDDDSDFDSGESDLSDKFSSDSEGPEQPEAHGPPSKRHKKTNEKPASKKKAKKLKPGKAGEEIRALTDFETDVATLQITEILKEVTLKEKKRQSALGWFSQLKACLQSVAKVSKKQIRVPLGPLPEDPQISEFVFRPPKSVQVVGSFAYETAVDWSALDIAVEMPKECFVRWDYHNLRYHRKRAIYLTHLASALQRAPTIHSGLKWRVNGDYRLPVLVVISPDGEREANILPFAEEGEVFALSRFASDKLNIQEKFFGLPNGSRQPVPLYNGGVLQDLMLVSTERALSTQLSSCRGIREGIQVLKMWLRSRVGEVGAGGPDGFSSFLLTIYVSHLLRTGRLNSMMGAYQVVRAVLAQIQADEWTNLLDDESGCHNYFYRLSPLAGSLLKDEARAALHSINSGSVTLINEVFSTRIPFNRKFDYFAKIQLGNDQKKDGWIQADFGGSLLWPTALAVLATLRKAFGHRVSLLASKPLEKVEWELSGDEIPEEANAFEIGWNLNLSGELAFVDKGPPADSKEAEEFRAFWGDKCEIRRFQDGSILESVLWPGETTDDLKKVTLRICEYILPRHHNVSRIVAVGESLDRMLELPRCHFSQRYGVGQEVLLEINKKFNEFGKLLRSIKDLPLSVSSVQGVSDELAYTAVFPSVAASCDTDARLICRVDSRCVPKADQGVPKLVKPVDILLVMETSSKWPDELGAIRHIKTAFYFALATKLEGRECQVFPEHLVVLFQGIVFRVRISCPKEIPLERQIITPEGMISSVENATSLRLEFEYFALPQLTSALHGLHSQNSTFGNTCRLAKRWLSCHMLYDAIPGLAVDLMVASLYIDPLPFSVNAPHSSRAGFQRFLHLLSNFDFRLNPLIVNINQQFNKNQIQQINSYFTRNRQALPALYIRTPFDRKENSYITSDKPMGPLLLRATQLARKCLNGLETRIAEGLSVLGAFRSSLEAYDFVIKLDERSVATYHQQFDNKEKLSFTKIRDEIPVVDFDPVSLYVTELKAAYGHLCAFFYDGFGGTDIGGLWIPKAQTPLPFKVHNVVGRKLMEPTKVLTPNYTAIFADIKALGQGLVKEVVQKRYPNNYNHRIRKDSR